MSILDFKRKKELGQNISLITCYDYPSAKIVSETNIDAVLVGDSVAMAVHGHDNSLHADINMMALHTKAVARGLKNKLIISDLPFLSHRGALDKTLDHVKTLIQSGAHAIKLEGGDEDTIKTAHYLITSGIPVMGHLGLTPQYFHQLGGFKVQGKNQTQAQLLFEQAKALQEAGCFGIVLECVPSTLASHITKALKIPVIGIGAGVETNGQILVWHDLLGIQTELMPKFVKQFLNGKSLMAQSINDYVNEVESSRFPTPSHSYTGE